MCACRQIISSESELFVQPIAHLGTAAHRGHQQPDGGLGWALFGTGWARIPQPGDTGSHSCHCSQNYYKPEKLSKFCLVT